jgi:hypothetical protein
MSLIRVGLIGLLALAIRPVAADDPKPDEDKRARQERLDFMKAKLAAFDLRAEGAPEGTLKLADEPALRWTNPIRGVHGDGATFFWSEGARPVAVATVSIRSEGKVFREFALLGDRPIVARRRGDVVWSPRKNAIAFGPLADSPVPAKSAVQRLTQLKALARRFRVAIIKGKPVEGRLMPQPLLRYASPESNAIDGAVFAFAEATDPEALLLLEARRDDAQPDGQWLFSFARMTSPQVEIRLDDRLVWTGLPYWNNARSKDDPYVEAYEGVYEGQEKDEK